LTHLVITEAPLDKLEMSRSYF